MHVRIDLEVVSNNCVAIDRIAIKCVSNYSNRLGLLMQLYIAGRRTK